MTEAQIHPAQNAMNTAYPHAVKIALNAKPSATRTQATSRFAAKIMAQIILDSRGSC